MQNTKAAADQAANNGVAAVTNAGTTPATETNAAHQNTQVAPHAEPTDQHPVQFDMDGATVETMQAEIARLTTELERQKALSDLHEKTAANSWSLYLLATERADNARQAPATFEALPHAVQETLVAVEYLRNYVGFNHLQVLLKDAMGVFVPSELFCDAETNKRESMYWGFEKIREFCINLSALFDTGSGMMTPEARIFGDFVKAE